MVMLVGIYTLCSPVPWEDWSNPGAHPSASDTAVKQENLCIPYEANKAVYDLQQNVKRAINNSLNLAILMAYCKLSGNQIGTKVTTVRDNPQVILADLRTKYGATTPD